MNHSATALTSQEQTSNPFWQHRGKTILAGDGNDDAFLDDPEKSSNN